MKRLYVVTVEFEFAVMASSEQEAKGFTDEAMSETDLSESARATPLRFVPRPGGGEDIALTPDGWEDDALVYGAKDDLTLKEAVIAERARVAAEPLS